MLLLALLLPLAGVLGAEFTLQGDCPRVKFQENLDYAKFSGVWYNVASYASDGRKIYDCAVMEFKQDAQGFTMRETYVDNTIEKRTQKTYFGRIDSSVKADSKTQFILSLKDNDTVFMYPLSILSTDYDNYAVVYLCRRLKHRKNKHYVFAWVLTRSKEKLQGAALKKVEDVLSEYPELSGHRQSFEFREFEESNCAYADKYEADNFSGNYF